MEIQDLLRTIGLNSKESAVYLALLELGPAKISQIAKTSRLHRPTVYQTLPKLMEKGLITQFPKGKQKHYVCEPPQKIEKRLSEVIQQAQELLPELEKIYTHPGQKPIIKFLESAKGIAFVHEDIINTLNRGDTYYRYSSPPVFKDERYLPKNYRVGRERKQIERLVITNPRIAKEAKPDLDKSIKTIPSGYGEFEYGITIMIYGHKIAFIDYNTETALIIENKTIAEFQKKIFKILYDRL